MVSLVNFRVVDEELRQRARVDLNQDGGRQVASRHARTKSIGGGGAQFGLTPSAVAGAPAASRGTSSQEFAEGEEAPSVGCGCFGQSTRAKADARAAGAKRKQSNSPPPPDDNLNSSSGSANFVVSWRNLKFSLEPKWPKWEKKLATGARHSSDTTIAPAPSPASSAADATSRLVLDRLDGAFRSGELTAILGPSGAGKTTLLDCLTGHRRKGLSGSIWISATCCSYGSQLAATTPRSAPIQKLNPGDVVVDAESGANYFTPFAKCDEFRCFCSSACCSSLDGAASSSPKQTRENNLKVSIIPQNDHLMGHLSVYESLNYASKMKNCFDDQFDHKLNISRVAQQLGLTSCLNTRINKLSGGQYKRVSIAQELLSSPDILILDEPTSGLDAMTCYQTVQVLRQLTESYAAPPSKADEHAFAKQQVSNGKPIAVILTIHQPNSDVFQQFNRVYVVAQGGKCIFEGPPSQIEPVINRIGLHLPSSFYNPATMIVEIAAGKFGIEAIHKLNYIQKKQYEFQMLNDEQNSTGDSAIDFSSSISSFGDDDDDDDDNQNVDSNTSPVDKTPGGGVMNLGFDASDEAAEKASLSINDTRLARRVEQQTQLDDNEKSRFEPIDLQDSNNNSGTTYREHEEQDSQRKRRRKTRKRNSIDEHEKALKQTIYKNDTTDKNSSCYLSSSLALYGAKEGGGGGGGSGPDDGSGNEKRLKLNSLKAGQKFPFWRHTYLHFHRSWLSIIRDPMLCSMQLALHVIVPLMVSLVYGTRVGKPNACPHAGPIDITAYSMEPADSARQLQEDLRTTLENIGYIFFKLYGIIFAAMTVTVLTFPLDMHVLVKEFRNGWYGLASYFLGRTLADIPFQLTLPFLAMALSYYSTGQPNSYLQWRFFSITAILILSSLIAQSQGLLFGAILMDRMKAAVFVAPAATTPIILFAGFLVRTQSIPGYLRPLSNLSYLRYAIEACLISRYGFNQCQCDPSVFNQTVPELPPIARSMLDYYLGSFKPSSSGTTTLATTDLGEIESVNSTSTDEGYSSTLNSTMALADSAESKPDLFSKLIDSLSMANSFGRNITSCEQVVPYPMIDYDLKDSQLFNCFAVLLTMLIFTRLLTFLIVCLKVKRKV